MALLKKDYRGIIVSTYKQYVKTGGICTLKQFLQPPTASSANRPLHALALALGF